MADVRVFELHRTAVHVVETHQQVDDRRFSGARRTDDRRRHAGLDVHRQIVDDLLVLRIAEIHVFCVDLSPDGDLYAEFDRVRIVRKFFLFVKKTENTFRGGSRRLEFVDDVRRFVDRAAELARVEHERGDIPDRDAAREVQQGTEHRHERQRDVVDEVDRRADHRTVVVGLEVSVGGGLVAQSETSDHGFFRTVRADGLLSGETFFRVAVQLTELPGTCAEQGTEGVRHLRAGQDRQRNGHREDETEHRGDRQHHDERADDGDKARRDLDEVVREGRVDRVDVVGNTGDDVARLVFVEVFDLHFHEFCEDILAHPADDAARQIDHHDLQTVRSQTGYHVRDEHEGTVEEYGFKIDLSRFDADRVNGIAGQLRTDEGEKIR